MPEILTFERAIDCSENTKRFLLLGNGFSIACDPNIFNYKSLYLEAAEKIQTEMPEVHTLLMQLGSKDFEAIIRMIIHAREVIPAYLPSDRATPKKLDEHIEKLKEILVATIADNHPAYPGSIPREKFAACRRFLSHFVHSESKGKVYSLNYDLLLYWALMNTDADGFTPINLLTNDGFGRDDPDNDYITWINEGYKSDQSIFYLHGALHLFDTGIAELEKFTWINSGKRLVDQAREALNKGKFPLFVAEGKSHHKLEKIRHQPYLHHAYKSFLQTVKEDRRKKTNQKSLFIFGHSFDVNDEHVIRQIGKGSISNLFVSIYGDPNSEDNKYIIQKALDLKSLRDNRHPLDVHFYAAESAKVWG